MRWRLAIALAGVAACGDIGAPALTTDQGYDFHLVFGLHDSVTFHWPRAALPVRVWVASNSPIYANVQTAIARWQGAFLYGEFRAVIVTDSSTADVIVRNDIPDSGGGLNRRAPQCVGETDPTIDPVAGTLTLPIHVWMYAVVAESVPGIPECYNTTMTHEMGHVIGLFAHSTTPSDVMNANPTADSISDRDRLTAVALYATPSTLTLTGRR